MKTVLAVASAGGHWIQLRRISPAFEGSRTVYVSTDPRLGAQFAAGTFHSVTDANMWSKLRMVRLAAQVLLVLIKVRPDVVVSTGAAPGFFAVVFGKCLGAKTVWIDSIANSEELSLAGRKVGRWADHWLTQWPELAHPSGPGYRGSVL